MSLSTAIVGASGEPGDEGVAVLTDEMLMTSLSSASTHHTGRALPTVQFKQMTKMVLDESV
eukprot:5846577-Prorocentrum_lima.AAC.1